MTDHERVPAPLRYLLEAIYISLVGAAAIAGGFIPSMGLAWVPVTAGEERYLQVLFSGWACGMLTLFALLPFFRGLDWVLARWLGSANLDNHPLQDQAA